MNSMFYLNTVVRYTQKRHVYISEKSPKKGTHYCISQRFCNYIVAVITSMKR